MANVFVTMPFTDAQIDRPRRVSPRLTVTRATAARADYGAVEVLYAGNPPGDLTRAPRLRWIQLHMASVDTSHDHPVYADRTIQLTTTSGVHAATVAEYALTMMPALAHRVPAMAAWKARGG
jgi:phosphoglycerate dehydrogenase-like enzyme